MSETEEGRYLTDEEREIVRETQEALARGDSEKLSQLALADLEAERSGWTAEEWDFEKPVGTKRVEANGDAYAAVFEGEAFVGSAEDQGVFLTDVSDPEHEAAVNEWYVTENKGLDTHIPMRREMTIGQLFPAHFHDRRFRYTITVQAELIDSPDPKPQE